MGWSTACVFVSKRENGFLGTFPEHLADRAREVVVELGWEFDGQPTPSQFDAGLAPPAGWFGVGAYDGALLLCGHPDLYGLVQDPEKPFVQRCLSSFPDEQVLFWELDETTNYIAYALYEKKSLQRAFVCDPDNGPIINHGELLPEEEAVVRHGSEPDWCEVAEQLLFALTGRFLGSLLNKFEAEKLSIELFKQRRSFWSKIGL